MQAIIEGPVHLEKASYTILTFVVLRPGKPPHDAAGSEWFVVDSILKLGANDGVIFPEDLWILLQSEQESRKASDEVFTAVVDSASSEQTAKPHLSSCSEFKCTNSGELQQLIGKKQKREHQAFNKYVGKTLPKVGRRTRLRSQHGSSS